MWPCHPLTSLPSREDDYMKLGNYSHAFCVSLYLDFQYFLPFTTYADFFGPCLPDKERLCSFKGKPSHIKVWSADSRHSGKGKWNNHLASFILPSFCLNFYVAVSLSNTPIWGASNGCIELFAILAQAPGVLDCLHFPVNNDLCCSALKPSFLCSTLWGFR